jgi:diketogulonate reductase-like aldo/keto reductase
VGLAIKESGLARSELYVATKYDGGDIQQAIRTSLKKLGLEYVDLYLIHFPHLIESGFENGWREFEKIKEDGLAKYVLRNSTYVRSCARHLLMLVLFIFTGVLGSRTSH